MVASLRLSRALALSALAVLTVGGAVAGQSTARVRTAENVRREPNGEILARMEPGATLAVAGRQDRWLEVDLEGWVWSRSLQTTEQAGFNVVVAEAQGENLRDAPSGTILGRLGRGTFLEEVERRPGWIRVRRRAWIWAPSVVELSTPAAAAPAAAGAGGPPARPTPTVPGAARSPGAITAAPRGAAILAAPDGDTVARVTGGTDLEVLSREGSWARVRLEGWTWLPQQASQADPPESSSGSLTPQMLAAEPAAHRGRVVSWELQFISLERAERVRTDFFEGEPFLLTRFAGPDGPFVYVALAADRVGELEGLVPLERLQVTGRVRTGASSLTGTPILDLVTLERIRAPR